MFTSVQRLLIAATMIVALSAPAAAYAYLGPASGGPVRSGNNPRGVAIVASKPSTSGQAEPSTAKPPFAAEMRQLRLGQLQAAMAQSLASQGGRPTTASRVQATGPSAQDGFRWEDAGIGAAGVLALIGIGAGGTLVIRRRMHRPLAS